LGVVGMQTYFKLNFKRLRRDLEFGVYK
jgi:hypothetical protein